MTAWPTARRCRVRRWSFTANRIWITSCPHTAHRNTPAQSPAPRRQGSTAPDISDPLPDLTSSPGSWPISSRLITTRPMTALREFPGPVGRLEAILDVPPAHAGVSHDGLAHQGAHQPRAAVVLGHP